MRNDQFENDIKTIHEQFNGLVIVEDDGECFLKGELPIIDDTGKLWDTYHIEMKGSESYPFRFPKLFETAGAFPKNADWHVYEDNFE